jgi:hypothetical protein
MILMAKFAHQLGKKFPSEEPGSVANVRMATIAGELILLVG